MADARPERIVHVVYVDSLPSGPGEVINPELPAGDGEIPLPDWSEFEDYDLVDLTDELRERFRDMAVPQPAAVASDPQVLHDERRYQVPVTVICCEFTSDMLRGWLDEGREGVAELAAVQSVTLVDLPTGHWPQLTRPADLADAILTAIS